MKPMSQASKTAIGGMVVALSVVLMLPTAIEVFVYALPAIAGMLTLFCVIELGRTWALGVYVASSVIGLLLIPNKEAVVLYAAFFGYYAIMKSIFESYFSKLPEYLFKFLLFNLSVVAAYALLVKVFGMPLNDVLGLEEGAVISKLSIPVFLGMGNLVFILYDYCLTRVATAYIRVLQRKLHKLFRFK